MSLVICHCHLFMILCCIEKLRIFVLLSEVAVIFYTSNIYVGSCGLCNFIGNSLLACLQSRILHGAAEYQCVKLCYCLTCLFHKTVCFVHLFVTHFMRLCFFTQIFAEKVTTLFCKLNNCLVLGCCKNHHQFRIILIFLIAHCFF